MELIKNLFEYFKNEQNIESQFTAKELKGTKILFVTPTLTADNFYRIILPFSYLEPCLNVNTAMLGIMTHNPTQLYEKRVTLKLKSKYIQWANAIVFPFTTQELKSTYAAIRTLHPTIRIIYNIDTNVFHLPDSHPMKADMTPEKLADINDNMLYADLTLTSNKTMRDYLVNEHFLTAKPMDAGTEAGAFEVYPFLANYHGIYENKEPTPNDGEKMRLVIPVNDTQYEDLASFTPVLQKVCEGLKEKVELIILGGRESDELFAKATEGITFTHIPAHPEVEEYYDHIIASKADAFLYLTRDTFYNKTMDDQKKIIDFGFVGVPCIIPACSPMAEIVREIGWVIPNNDALYDVLSQISNHRPTLQEHAVATFNKTIQSYSFDNSEALLRLDGIF